MYAFLLLLHSITRWGVVITLAVGLATAYSGLLRRRPFTRGDRMLVSAAVGMTHLQLTIGLLLMGASPFVRYFWGQPIDSLGNLQLTFFGVLHEVGMITAVVLMSIGGARAKRADDDRLRFAAVARYFTAAALLIVVMIPWPFSPLAQRPLVRW